MNNKLADDILTIYDQLKIDVKNKIIADFKIKLDEENNCLDIYLTPIKKNDYINIDFMITSSGCTY